MRLDKFLKVSRLIKRRTVANDLSSAGGVEINGKLAKPATSVQVGDVLTIHLGPKVIQAKILVIPTGNVPIQMAETLYTLLDDRQ